MQKTIILMVMSVLVFNIHTHSQVEISGNITSDSVLSEGSHYILTGNLTIKSNATLTIQKNVQVDLRSYNIYVGTTTSGKLIAEEATFTSNGSSDKEICFKDGGGGTINKCNFQKVRLAILDDAAFGISITENNFTEVVFPLVTHPARIPSLNGNSSNIEIIGIEGTLEESVSLPQMQWEYALSGSLTVRQNAIFTIEDGVSLDFTTKTLYIGSSSQGSLNASNVTFFTESSAERNIIIKDGGAINLSGCSFNHVSIDIDNDAGENNIISCNFNNIVYPLVADINRIPNLQGNTSSVQLIGTGGIITENTTLQKLEWDYILSSSISVKNDAVLTLSSDLIIDLKTSNILVGNNASPGKILADHISFKSTSSSDKAIKFANGGTGTLGNCYFDNVYIDIMSDAGESVSLTENIFSHINWPVRTYAQHLPIMNGNHSDNPQIGLKGDITSSCIINPLEWPYALTESIDVKNNAVLSIQPGAIVLLNGFYIYVGSSATNTGVINAEGVRFYDLDRNFGRLYFRPNSSGTISGCFFFNCRLHIDGASPTIEHSRFTRCREAIYTDNAANPVIRDNDFYNNVLALDNRGDYQVNVSQNWWAHSTGPIHDSNPGGQGETVKGDLNLIPFLSEPFTGGASFLMEPSSQLFTDLATGSIHQGSFLVRNTGDEDLLINKIETSSSSISVSADDRIWILPDSSFTISYSFVALEPGPVEDTIFIHTNDQEKAIQHFVLQGDGHYEDLLLNFYHIDIDSFPIVRCLFTLTDQAMLPVRAITKNQLELKEQNIMIPDFELSTRSAQSAVNVAMVIDKSGSMLGSPLRDAKNAASDFIMNLSVFDMASIISFNRYVTLEQSFTSDKQLLIQAINRLRAEESTAVFDAIDMAIEEVKDMEGVKAILALSDGQDNASKKTAADVINKARLYGINIYTIGLGDESEPTLTSIAWQTGGQYYYSPTSKELSLIYRMISGQIQNMYVARYIADEEGPFPRKVDLGVRLEQLYGSETRFYSIGNGEIDFAGAGSPFKQEAFSALAANYFYYYINDAGSLIPEDYSVTWFMDSHDQTFPCGFKYLGDGILQVWMDLRNMNKPGEYTFSFPDSVDQSGGWLTIKNKPEDFNVTVGPRRISQNIDLFGGGSVGGSVILGGVGAGPSVAAAKVSATAAGGMGLNFERDASGNEWITRRLEVSLSTSVEAPSVNVGIDVIDAGISSSVATTGTVGQSLFFPADHPDPSLILKAKAAYVLETLSIGGIATCPFFGVVLVAVVEALKITNPDVDAIYDQLFESWNVGANLEGSVGVEFSLSPGESSGIPALTLAEASASLTLGGSMVHYVQTNDLAFELAMALAFDVGLLNLEISGVDLGNVFDNKMGSEITLGADFSSSEGFEALNLGYLAFESASLGLADGFYGKTLDIQVPKKVIIDGIDKAGTLIHDVYNIFEPDGGLPNIRIGANQLTASLQEFFSMDDDTLLNPEDHINIEIAEQFTKGINIDVSVGLDAALGLGAGLSLGVNLIYMDEVAGPESDYIIAHGMLLPLYISNGVSGRDKLFSIKDEFYDLLDGVIDLVADGIANLVAVAEFALEYGLDFAVNTVDGACGLAGNALDYTYGKISSADPRFWKKWNEPLMDSDLKYMYSSNRVGRENTPWNLKSANPGESELYLISFAHDVSLFDDSDQLVEDFESLRLKLAIKQEMFSELNFSENDKARARIYRYVPETISWIRMDEDFCSDADSISVDITHSATYAVGIEISPEDDHDAPQIIDHNPNEGDGIAPRTQLWAKLYESPMGVGIDFGSTRILLDGIEVEATWDPINSLIAHKPGVDMEIGSHQMKVETADYQGNSSSLTVNFTVYSTGIDETKQQGGFNTKLYPNPFTENINIEYFSKGSTETEVAVYNAAGTRVAVIFRGKCMEGSNLLTWGRKLDNGNIAAKGLYFIRISQETMAEVCKIVIQL